MHLHRVALRFSNAEQQYQAVNKVMDILLNSMTGLNREHLKALDWSLNEITDNVLSHAKSPVGGFIQASTYSQSKRVEFIVADAGIGIPESLKISNHEKALLEAIKEGITNNKETNQGNGLFGSQRVASMSGGEFQIHSCRASLQSKQNNPPEVTKQKIPYPGTVVQCLMDCTSPRLLEEALRFNNKPHDPPFDFIEREYTDQSGEHMILHMNEHLKYLGSREAGAALRNKIFSLLSCVPPDKKLRIDFSGVSVISSSVADEVFGMLFQEFGPMTFMSRLELTGIDSTVRGLIDRAILLRTLNSKR
ncbi:MAG: sensor histidine kinase [Magnetococcales bacterium]|nr:sensor histidine kinase [Magnetococcales bacterium]NGZ29150.1 sensor histidine kinase [Magnetococcales bacterium]